MADLAPLCLQMADREYLVRTESEQMRGRGNGAFPIKDNHDSEVTNPADETVATAVFVDDHVTVAPGIVAPSASVTVGVSVAVSANEANERLVGDSVTEDAT